MGRLSSLRRASLILSLLSVGLLLRAYGAVSFPLSFDELIQFDILSQNNSEQLISYLRSHDRQMPLSYLLVHPFISAGFSELLGLRLPSLFFGAFALFVFFIHTRKTLGLRFGLWGSALLGVNYLALEYSTTMRPYSLLLMLSTLSQLLYGSFKGELHKTGRVRLKVLLAFALTLLCLFFTHYYGSFIALILLLFTLVLLSYKYQLFQRFEWLFYLLGGFLLLGGVLIAAKMLSSPIYPHPNHLFPSLKKILYLPFILLSTFGPGIVLSFLFIRKMIKEKRWYENLECSLIGLGLPLISLVISYSYYPAFEYRFFIGCVPWLLWSLLKFISLQRRFLILPLLLFMSIDSLSFALLKEKFLSAPERIDFPSLIQSKALTSKKRGLFCGNCPSYYFSNFSCKSGWDFSGGEENLESFNFVFIFKENEVFCRDSRLKNWKKTELSKGTLYERDSSSRY